MAEPPPKQVPSESSEKLKYSQYMSSPIISITVAKSSTFRLHRTFLTSESERFSRSLSGGFKEAKENTIALDDEDPDLFGFFIEWLYRNRCILSRAVEHYSHYVTLARLYALGERLLAPNLQSYCLWRFTESLSSISCISDESVCELLRIAATEITERSKEDPMRAHIFWYAFTQISSLQKFDMFAQLLRDIPDLGAQLCLCMGDKYQPEKPDRPIDLLYKKFAPESEYGSEIQVKASASSDVQANGE